MQLRDPEARRVHLLRSSAEDHKSPSSSQPQRWKTNTKYKHDKFIINALDDEDDDQDEEPCCLRQSLYIHLDPNGATNPPFLRLRGVNDPITSSRVIFLRNDVVMHQRRSEGVRDTSSSLCVSRSPSSTNTFTTQKYEKLEKTTISRTFFGGHANKF